MATAARHSPHPPEISRPFIPPLEAGDRLSREEFFRRYEAMPEAIKAERIEGIVYMPAAWGAADFHGVPHAHLTANPRHASSSQSARSNASRVRRKESALRFEMFCQQDVFAAGGRFARVGNPCHGKPATTERHS